MIPGIPGLDKGPPDPTTTHLPTPFVKASHKLLEFSQKVAHNFSKSCSKVARKLLRQKLLQKICCSLPLFGLMQKYNKSKTRFLSIFYNFPA